MGAVQSAVSGNQAGSVLHVVFEFRSEVLEHSAHRHCGRITEGTNRAAHDVVRHVVE
jgi:hypothetical protein